MRDSFLHNDRFMNKLFRKRFKACRSLFIEIGNVGKVDRTTFVKFMYEIIVVNVVNLLVMSKKY